MKFKFLTLVLTKLLGVDEEAEKADMHLPVRIAGFGLALILGGFIALSILFTTNNYGLLIAVALFWGLAPFTFLCYKNQRIYVLSDEEFEYSTFTGRKTVYKFDEIKSLRANQDSMTLFVGDGKVHIESCAILSERFMSLVNASLAKNTQMSNN